MTLSVTATMDSSTAPARVLVAVTSSPAATAVLRIYRVHEDGSRHRVLTDGMAKIVGSWSGYDIHAPFNQLFTYVASTGLEADSAPSSAVYVSSERVWLQHQTDHDLAYPVDKILAPQQDVSRSSRATEYKILKSKSSVVRTDSPLEADTGSFTIRVARDDIPSVEALLEDGAAILLNGPWGSYDYGWSWIWVKSVKRSNAGGRISFPTRNYTIDYQVTADPDADTEPAWTYADAKAAFPAATYASMPAIWASYQNAHLDIRS